MVEPSADGAVLSLGVSDTGPGIVPDQHERISDRFTQADSSIRREKGGTGLGLAISRAIARGMGGRIDLQSAQGQSSTFTVRIPVRTGDRSAGGGGALGVAA